MSIANLPRLIITSLAMLVLAVVLVLQAVSGVMSKPAPDLALSVPFANGLANERLAYQRFASEVTDPNDPTAAAKSAQAFALSAYKLNAITPKALAILVMAEGDQATRSNMLRAASRLNRRDATLQSLVLQEAIAANDHDRSVEALDQMLRVHPELSQDLFPVLAEALRNQANTETFAGLLDGSSPWHERFLKYALNDPELLPILAKVRSEITVEDERFDQRLVAGLASRGEFDLAQSVVARANADVVAVSGFGALSWSARFPPFDWKLVDEQGIRAQLASAGDALELYVRAGNGGLLAERLLQVPDAPFAISVDHRIAPIEQVRDMRLQLACANNNSVFLDERFGQSPANFTVSAVPPDCQTTMLRILGRAWSGRSHLNGNIHRIEIKAQ